MHARALVALEDEIRVADVEGQAKPDCGDAGQADAVAAGDPGTLEIGDEVRRGGRAVGQAGDIEQEQVAARTAGQHVDTGAAGDGVVAPEAVERVVARPAQQAVCGEAARERIIAARRQQRHPGCGHVTGIDAQAQRRALGRPVDCEQRAGDRRRGGHGGGIEREGDGARADLEPLDAGDGARTEADIERAGEEQQVAGALPAIDGVGAAEGRAATDVVVPPPAAIRSSPPRSMPIQSPKTLPARTFEPGLSRMTRLPSWKARFPALSPDPPSPMPSSRTVSGATLSSRSLPSEAKRKAAAETPNGRMSRSSAGTNARLVPATSEKIYVAIASCDPINAGKRARVE